MEERLLRDSAWSDLRLAVPAFETRWQELVADPTYDDELPFVNIDQLARFVASELLTTRPGALHEIGLALEKLFDQAAENSDVSLYGLLTVGFLENLLLEADARGIPLTRIEPMLHGIRTYEHWERAVTYLKPGFHWEDGIGPVASHPRPIPIGTVEIHSGSVDRAARILYLEVRLVAGTLRAGCLIRRQVSRNVYVEWVIAAATHRWSDVSTEYYLEIKAERDEMFEAFELEVARLAFRPRAPWEIARRPSTTSPSYENERSAN